MSRALVVAATLACLAACAEHEAPPMPTPSIVPEPAPPPPPPPPTRAGPLCTYHGVCWARPGPQGNALHAVRALASDHVIAVGDRGTVLAWNGHEWSLEDTPNRERLLDVAIAPIRVSRASTAATASSSTRDKRAASSALE